MCHPSESEAIARGAECTNFFGYSLAHYYVFCRHQPGVTDVWAEYQRDRAQAGYDPAALGATDSLPAKGGGAAGKGLRGAVGTPDQIRDYLRRYENYGVYQVILASQTGKNGHEHVKESLELFGREVLPEFLERDEAASVKKARRMEPVIEAAMARKPASDHPPLPDPDYDFPAIPRSMADREGADGFHAWLDDYARKAAAGEDISKRLSKPKRADMP